KVIYPVLDILIGILERLCQIVTQEAGLVIRKASKIELSRVYLVLDGLLSFGKRLRSRERGDFVGAPGVGVSPLVSARLVVRKRTVRRDLVHIAKIRVGNGRPDVRRGACRR